MANGNTEVSRSRPCPICGKSDYCSFWRDSNGFEQIICKRSSTEADVVGRDGRAYKFLRLSKENRFTVYQDMDTYEAVREAEKDAWMQQNKVGPYNPRWNFGSFLGSFKKKQKEKRPCETAPVVLQQRQEVVRVNWIEPLPHKERDRFYRSLLSHLVLDEVHRAYLEGEGWSGELIRSSLAKSLPIKDFVRMKYRNFDSENPYRRELAEMVMKDLGLKDLYGYPGAFIDPGDRWTLNGPSGIVFPIYDADGYIYGLRIRMDFMDIPRALASDDSGSFYEHASERYYLKPLKGWYTRKGGQERCLEKNGYWVEDSRWFKELRGKYRPVTSFFEDAKELEQGRSVNVYKGGCQLESGTSLYFDPEKDDPTICYITEGEKKGIFGNAELSAPLLTFPGVDGWGSLFEGNPGKRFIDRLKEMGVQVFVIVYDADKATNEAVLRAQDKVLQAIRAEGFFVGIGNWPVSLGKGLDDLLARGGLPSYDLV